jgi:hypothetical protein
VVSVWSETWTQTFAMGEAVETGEIVKIANIHAVSTHVAENVIGC